MEFAVSKIPSPPPYENSHISRLSTGYIIGNKYICKIQAPSFNLIQTHYVPWGVQQKSISSHFPELGSWTIRMINQLPKLHFKLFPTFTLSRKNTKYCNVGSILRPLCIFKISSMAFLLPSSQSVVSTNTAHHRQCSPESCIVDMLEGRVYDLVAFVQRMKYRLNHSLGILHIVCVICLLVGAELCALSWHTLQTGFANLENLNLLKEKVCHILSCFT